LTPSNTPNFGWREISEKGPAEDLPKKKNNLGCKQCRKAWPKTKHTYRGPMGARGDSSLRRGGAGRGHV